MRMNITSVILGSLLVLGFAAHAQTPQPEHQQTPAKPSTDMAAKCKAMMAEHEKMMAEMKAADQRLDELVTKMNSASGQARVDATAAAVTEIVAQRKTMRDRMMQTHQGMMSHMMEHMQTGPQSMAMCPMMKMGAMTH
jgi:vancomycin resistance protein YoaR